MRAPLHFVSVTGVAVLVSACAGSSDLERELSRLRRDVHTMKKDLSQTRRQVERLEGRVTMLSLGEDRPKPAPKTPVAGAAPAVKGPGEGERWRQPSPNKVLPVVRLGAKADAPKGPEEEYVDPGALDDGSPPIMIKLRGDQDPPTKLPVDREVLKRPDPVLDGARARGEKASYRAALAKLRDDRDPQAALSMFRSFYQTHPSSKLADNAAYWAGECLFQLVRYREAIAQFEAVLSRHPGSSKVPYAVFKIGESLLELGSHEEGRASMQRVIDEFPNSEAAARARARLDG